LIFKEINENNAIKKRQPTFNKYRYHFIQPMKKKTTYLTIICLLIAGMGMAQDIHFSQIFETPILRNPSLAGIYTGDIRIQAIHRNQWNSVTDAYQTTSVSGETKTNVGQGSDFISYGGQIVYDKSGTVALSTTKVMPVFTYNKSMSDYKNIYLSIGFMGGIVQRSIDRSKMTTNNQYDGVGYNGGLADGETFNSPNYAYFDGNVGMSLNSQIGDNENNNLYLGVAYHHFNQAKKISFYAAEKEAMTAKWVSSAGMRFDMTNTSYFTLEADYSVQGKYQEIIAGALYTWKLSENEESKYFLHGGAYMRWKDAIIPVLKLEFRPLSVSMSYDANISPLKTASYGRGGFECSISYVKTKTRNSSLDAVRCMKF
jgi:type IX secretion system PorP/SprF family membrane protein